ncbi:MAG TPA: hypothetical protein GXX20_06810 [Clostridiaceae bacterium]|nr:hypothetical protein [Clostridiaceae bacterium]
MKGKKKITVLILGSICSIALVGGSAFAMENKWLKDGKEPTVFAKGDGESYSREELADKLRMTLEEIDGQVRTYEFPLTNSTRISGRVENGIHTAISKEKEDYKEPTVFTRGDGESYSREELADKLRMTLEEIDGQVRTYEFPLTDSTESSGKK